MRNFAFLLLRLFTGTLMVGHGAQKLFGWFEGPGLQGMAGMLEKQGFPQPQRWAWLAALSEFGGGLRAARAHPPAAGGPPRGPPPRPPPRAGAPGAGAAQAGAPAGAHRAGAVARAADAVSGTVIVLATDSRPGCDYGIVEDNRQR